MAKHHSTIAERDRQVYDYDYVCYVPDFQLCTSQMLPTFLSSVRPHPVSTAQRGSEDDTQAFKKNVGLRWQCGNMPPSANDLHHSYGFFV